MAVRKVTDMATKLHGCSNLWYDAVMDLHGPDPQPLLMDFQVISTYLR